LFFIFFSSHGSDCRPELMSGPASRFNCQQSQVVVTAAAVTVAGMGRSGLHGGAEEGMYLERSGHLLRFFHGQLSCTQTTEYSVLLHRSALSIPAGGMPAMRLLQLSVMVAPAAIAIAKRMAGGGERCADVGMREE
jgi:hypothetical protein